MFKVGITGGIGSGKTFVCELFKMYGIPVYNADVRAKLIMYQNKSIKAEIKNLLSSDAYHRNGRPNRPFIASKVFHDKALLESLNAIVHPAVNDEVKAWFEAMEQAGHPYAIKEAALLVETGSYKSLDKLIVVTAPEKLRIQRVIKRDRTSIDLVKSRISKQLPDSDKIKLADFIINNDEQSSLIAQVQAIHSQLIKG